MSVPGLTGITVEVGNTREGHADITVAGVTDDDRFADAPEDDIHGADLYVAGLLARLALEAHAWLAYEAATLHGCRPAYGETAVDGWVPKPQGCCHVYGAETLNLGETPAVYLAVPSDRAGIWLDRIGAWLAKLAEAER